MGTVRKEEVHWEVSETQKRGDAAVTARGLEGRNGKIPLLLTCERVNRKDG